MSTGSLLLARRFKRQTLGLEPREIAGLVEHREAMLHGIKEGLIGLDTAGRVTLANDEALRLLGLPPDVTGPAAAGQRRRAARRPAHRGRRRPGRGRGARRARPGAQPDAGGRARHRGRFGHHAARPTELTSLERELDLSRNATDTLRAQAHEFTNRLHTISGLLQLGQYDDAVSFIIRAGQEQEALSNDVQSRIADPALAALIIAKASVATEQRVALVVSADSAVPEPVDDRLAADLVTVTGNLIDNAIDAVAPGGQVEVGVRRDGDDVVVTVRDSGPGVAPELAEEVFRSGFTTKAGAGHRGLGLALISRVCTAPRRLDRGRRAGVHRRLPATLRRGAS